VTLASPVWKPRLVASGYDEADARGLSTYTPMLSWTRAAAVLEIVGGVAEAGLGAKMVVGGSAAALPSAGTSLLAVGAGAFLFVDGANRTAIGLETLWTNKRRNTLLYEAVLVTTGSPELACGADIAVPLIACGKAVAPGSASPALTATGPLSTAKIVSVSRSASGSAADDVAGAGSRVARPGSVSGNPANRLVETGRPLKSGNGWARRWIRMTEADELAQQRAIANRYNELLDEATQRGLTEQARRDFLFEQMRQFREKWLKDFLMNRGY
jgi:hypothetical protein